jgi:hypothetical protein
MFIGFRILLIITLTGWINPPVSPIKGNPTKAFQDYFTGVSHFKEGNIPLANQYFHSAHANIPTNFSFCLSYSLTQGKLNRLKEAEELLRQSNALIKGNESDVQEKKALISFFKGMIQIYNTRFDEAQISLKTAQKNFESMGEKTMVSIIHNAIGFSIFANQGMNLDKSNEKKLHGHIYPVSLFRSASYFQKSLFADPSNIYAQHNFNLLNDTLCLDFSAPIVKKPILNVDQISADWEAALLNKLAIHPNDEVVFLLDISGSMITEKVTCSGLDRFRTAQWLTNRILGILNTDKQVGIGSIGGDCHTPQTVWKKVGTTSIKDIQNTISSILPEGSTPLAKMLALSPDLFSTHSNSRKSLIVISDGANTCPHPQQDICTSAKILSDKNINVHVLSFLQNTVSHAAAFADYECLTETTSGKLLYLEDNQCQMKSLSYDLVQACGLKLPSFEKSNCLGPSIPNLWMYYKSDLFIDNNKN